MKLKNIIILICIFSMCLPLFACAGGDPHQKSVALKSENFTISRGALAYFFVRTMQSSLDSYSDKDLSDLGYDKSKSPSDQKFSEGKTWFDFFLDSTLKYTRELLVLCEAAKAEGFTVNSEELAKKIEAFKARSESTYSVSFEKYLEITYFGYTDEQDYTQALELEFFAGSYMEKLTETFYGNVSPERIEEYIQNNTEDPINDRTRSFMMIYLASGGTEKAESLLSLYPSRSFDDLAREFSASKTYLYENCQKDELERKEGEWLFSEARKAGDTGIIEHQNGHVSIMYYLGEGLTVSESEALFALAKSDYSAYLDSLFKRFSVKFEEEIIKTLVI